MKKKVDLLTDYEKQIIREQANFTPLAFLAQKLDRTYAQVYDYLESLPMSDHFRERQ